MPWLWHVLCPQLGGYCGWWKRAVPGWFRVKMGCIGAAKELSGTQLRSGVALHPFKPPTLDNHIFLVCTPIRTFLDSMESPLSLESYHIPMDGIWYSNIY